MRCLSILCCLLLLGLCACPQPEEGGKGTAQPGQEFQPSAPIPAEGVLLNYDGLKLGMSTTELSQIYNAPEGKGEGFFRGLQDYDAVQTHVIEFERPDNSGPRRTLTLSFYRDQLYIIVDRIEGISPQQADEWFAKLGELYGSEPQETVKTAQWSWGSPDEVQMVFTRDNSSTTSENANVVLEHKPTGEAAYNYLADWEKQHPDFLKQREEAARQQQEQPTGN